MKSRKRTSLFGNLTEKRRSVSLHTSEKGVVDEVDHDAHSDELAQVFTEPGTKVGPPGAARAADVRISWGPRKIPVTGD